MLILFSAYWYGELEYRENVTRKERNITVFKALPANKTKIYEHECFPINRPEVLEDETGKESALAGMTPAERAKFHKVSLYPTSAMDPGTKIKGDKVGQVLLELRFKNCNPTDTHRNIVHI
jgi:hypothetical protein